MARSFVPSIVPNGHDQTVYLVVNNFGKLGTAFAETDVGKADLVGCHLMTAPPRRTWRIRSACILQLVLVTSNIP